MPFTRGGNIGDHPRSRGVYFLAWLEPAVHAGSSPLARGLPPRSREPQRQCGIIPARAGFTQGHQGGGCRDWDHPRSRGVYSGRSTYVSQQAGSSPLARGLHAHSRSRRRGTGIIPARAGFTRLRRSTPRTGQDHPRSRGVYRVVDTSKTDPTGSSPLARGLLRRRRRRLELRGIIPARAGFTRRRGKPRNEPKDHPRSRGVYASARSRRWSAVGSSPLARGLLGHVRPVPRVTGIIPARAGFTCRASQRGVCSRDHPRSRGVYGMEIEGSPGVEGSSPLARGLPLGDLHRRGCKGIIPARAGFTSSKNQYTET